MQVQNIIASNLILLLSSLCDTSTAINSPVVLNRVNTDGNVVEIKNRNLCFVTNGKYLRKVDSLEATYHNKIITGLTWLKISFL